MGVRRSCGVDSRAVGKLALARERGGVACRLDESFKKIGRIDFNNDITKKKKIAHGVDVM